MRSGFAAFVLLATASLAPVHAALFGGGDDVARKGLAEQQKRVDGLYTRYDEIAVRITKLEDAVKAQASSGNQPVLELAGELQSVREDLRSLRGQIEVLSNNIEANAKRQRDMYVDLDARMRRFEQNVPAASAPAAPPGPGAMAPAGTSSTSASGAVSGNEAQAYEAAQGQRRLGNYQAAIVAFQAFVAQHPKSSLAHRAQYWIGDSYYNLRDFRNAIGNQQKLIATYPDSPSVPDALLNIASSQIELGDNASARKTMDNLVARYPTSEAAEKAKRRLSSLR